MRARLEVALIVATLYAAGFVSALLYVVAAGVVR